LSVRENLTIASRTRGDAGTWSLGRVYDQFPILKERSNLKGNLLSGGEQQMLAICRALMTNPKLLMMDEPSEGLAPVIVRELSSIIGNLKESGLSLLLVEQNVSLALNLADYVYVVSKGKIVYESTPDELQRNEEVQHRHLGVAK
jgi:branched-chain amino acid transport system ATP-binding protein